MSFVKKSCGCFAGAIVLAVAVVVGSVFVLSKLGEVQKGMREEQKIYEARYLPEFKNLGVVIHQADDVEREQRVQYLAVDAKKIKSRWEIVVLINKFLVDDLLLDEVRITKTDEGFQSTLDTGYLRQWFGETKFARSTIEEGVRYAIPLSQESLKLFPDKRERLDSKPPMTN